MNSLAQKPMQQASRIAKSLGRTRAMEGDESKHRTTGFTRSFGNRTAQVMMRR